jgi:hypothetical protein
MKTKLTLLLAGCALSLATSYAQTTSWLLTGNSGTDSSKNFLGTTDAVPLVFRVNNFKAGYLDYDSLNGNTAFGFKSMFTELNAKKLSPYGGNFNTSVGYQTLYFNRQGSANTVVGYQALFSNAGGGWYNTAVGFQALHSNFRSGSNTAIGSQALFNNGKGWGNTANGVGALFSNSGGILILPQVYLPCGQIYMAEETLPAVMGHFLPTLQGTLIQQLVMAPLIIIQQGTKIPL